MLASDTGISIVVDQSLDAIPVTIEVEGQTVDNVLNVVARRAGVQVSKTGNLYFLGQLRKEDRASLVRCVRRLSRDDIHAALATLESDMGAHAVFPGGLVVVGDRVEVLARINEMFDQVEAAESAVWVVQLYLLSLSKGDLRDLGMDLTPALDVSLAFAAGSSTAPAAAVGPALAASSSLSGGLDALLRVARKDEDAALVAERTFYLGDGDSGRMVRGERIPVPRKTVSEQGTVTTNGFDYIQTGVQMDVLLRETTERAANLTGNVSLSRVTGYVENAPIVINEEMDLSGNMASGGVYLLRAMEQRETMNRYATGLRLGRSSEAETRFLQLWARACRVGGDAGGSEAVSLPDQVGSEKSLPGPTPGVEGPTLLPPIVESAPPFPAAERSE